jgi:superfamily II DNA or RNA helicase
MIMDVAARHAAAGDKFLILCNRVAHAVGLAAALKRRAPWPVLGLDGGAPDDERERVLSRFKSEAGGAVLVCTPFFREGVDVPQIDAGFLAGGGASDIATLQALGRMLTVRKDKTEVLIYDCLDGRDPRRAKDYLAQHAWASRLPLYRAQGFLVEGA